MMGNVHKTDKLDAQGLATLQYLGKLPSVWIPPAQLRDERELPRTRMAFAKHRAMVKNRIRSTLAKYALGLTTDSDIFTPKWRPDLEGLLEQLPPETGRCVRQHLQILDALNQHIARSGGSSASLRPTTSPAAAAWCRRSAPAPGGPITAAWSSGATPA
jgi:transposase